MKFYYKCKLLYVFYMYDSHLYTNELKLWSSGELFAYLNSDFNTPCTKGEQVGTRSRAGPFDPFIFAKRWWNRIKKNDICRFDSPSRCSQCCCCCCSLKISDIISFFCLASCEILLWVVLPKSTLVLICGCVWKYCNTYVCLVLYCPCKTVSYNTYGIIRVFLWEF